MTDRRSPPAAVRGEGDRRSGLWERLSTRLAAEVDEALLFALSSQVQRRPEREHQEGERAGAQRERLEEATAFYSGLGDALFPPLEVPPGLVVARTASESLGRLRDGGARYDLKWESGWRVRWERAPSLDSERFASNRAAYARVWLHPGAAPSVICLHGYGGGRLGLEERLLGAERLYGLGLHVALLTLPYHGPRAVEGISFPSLHAARTAEGFGQAVRDLRWLATWLRARGGQPEVAVTGMSLGGYTAALFATVESLAALHAFIPVASLGELMWDHGRGTPASERALRQGVTRSLVRAAFAVHCPLERKPLLAGDRVLVSASLGDRVTPLDEGERLARHFGTPLLELPGGHLLQTGRGRAFEAFASLLGRHGLTGRR
jgi:pimeloyl-ACP methyl ester carboxylesterase